MWNTKDTISHIVSLVNRLIQAPFRARLSIPLRSGVSPRVIEAAKRLMQEYQPDLDYLKDH